MLCCKKSKASVKLDCIRCMEGREGLQCDSKCFIYAHLFRLVELMTDDWIDSCMKLYVCSSLREFICCSLICGV